jgi:eukaryotic-like serine/threonine-protein kinase
MSATDDEASRTTPPAPGVGSGARRTFADDELIAGRYRAVRFIARGGMGEVYEVEDTELHTRVALKTIRVDLVDDEAVLERFRSELGLARRVTHANVCRLFDLGFHDTPRGRITFLTMELLDGESLRQRIRRGRLEVKEALPIVEQMVAGLAAAHAFGIVHRDFKSDNVMLVPSPSGPARVVITDFGLARNVEGATLPTISGELKGTPAYMAPEQLTNGRITAAVDLYALGVVLYEMMTATLPFSGGNAMAVAVKRLTERPQSPRRLVPALDVRWERAILRCLEREPTARFANVAELVPALVGDVPVRRPRWHWTLGALALAAVVAAVTGGLALRRAHRPVAAARGAVAGERRALAVLGLRNLTSGSDVAWLGTALPELLAAEVTAEDTLRRVPDENVARARRDLQLSDGAVPAPELARRLGNMLDADYVLSGAYLAAGDGRVRLDLTLQDARDGQTLAAVSETGSKAALLDLVAAAGEQLRHGLGLPGLSAADREVARASLPTDPTAARAYAEGLARLRSFDPLGALAPLQRVAEAEPNFPLAHAALAEASRRLGRQTDEEREAKLAWEHAAGLPRPEQLVVEANLRVAERQWPRALELYHALYDFYPGSLDYGLQLAEVQERAGQSRAALETIAQLRSALPSTERDPRVELVEARASESAGEFRREDAAAQRAAEKARALGATELVGDALLFESFAAMTLGDRPRAAARATAAWELFVRIGNPFKIGRALRRRGGVAYKAGQLTMARELVLQSVAIFDKLGAGDDLANAYNTLGGIESDLHHPVEAVRCYRLALPLFEKAANRDGVATVHLNLGQRLASAHRYAEAEAEEQGALAVDRETGNRRVQAIALESLGGLAIDLGELDRAVELERQAIAVATEIQDVTTIAQTRGKLARALHLQGKVAASEAAFRESIQALRTLGETWRVANQEIALAALYLDIGRVADAAALATSAVALHKSANVDTRASAAMRARTLVAGGQLAEARTVIDGISAQPQAGEDELTVQMAAAEVELAEGHGDRVRERLDKAVAAATPPVADRFDAALLIARAELATGQKVAARKRLAAVAAEARARGFALVLGHATDLRR